MSITVKNLPADVAAWAANATSDDATLALVLGSKLFISGAVDALRPQTSDKAAVRGQVGEQYVQEVLSRRYNVRNNAKTARAGDMQLYIDDVKILVEVKNYTRTVPTAEVEKFTRDLSSGLYYGGLFVSLNTDIVGGRNSLFYEQCGDTYLPVVYISSQSDDMILMAAQTVVNAVAAQRHSVRELYNRDFLAGEIRVLTEQLDALSRTHSAYLDTIDGVNSSLRKSATGIAIAESNLRRTVTNIRTELFDQKIIKCDQIAEHLRTKGVTVSDELGFILSDICAGDSTPEGTWRTYKTKVVHLVTGISINFTKTRLDVTFPSKMVDESHVVRFYARHPGKMTLDGGDLTITVDTETVKDIREQFTSRLVK